jgi:hypothetical protein
MIKCYDGCVHPLSLRGAIQHNKKKLADVEDDDCIGWIGLVPSRFPSNQDLRSRALSSPERFSVCARGVVDIIVRSIKWRFMAINSFYIRTEARRPVARWGSQTCAAGARLSRRAHKPTKRKVRRPERPADRRSGLKKTRPMVQTGVLLPETPPLATITLMKFVCIAIAEARFAGNCRVVW